MRISRDQMFMDIAEVAAKRSTCYRGGTGAVIVKDRDLLSIGYNGSPSGEEHCFGNHCPLLTDGGCRRSVHAEKNAVERAMKKIRVLDGCHLYTTSAPCRHCATMIALTGIGSVTYRYPYRDREGLERLTGRIPVFRLTPSGILIDEKSGEIIE